MDTAGLLAIVVGAAAGGVAGVTGFGIGSLLTPVLALQVDTRLAVAAVSIPHVAGTALRLWLLVPRSPDRWRSSLKVAPERAAIGHTDGTAAGGIDQRVFWNFGLTSAAGGLAGALLQGRAGNRWLTLIFGLLLLFTGAGELAGVTRRMRLHGPAAWIAGAVSGLLGGLVGNQGGIRSAALLGFDLSKQKLVATATAVALLVDGARMPVYVATQAGGMAALGSWMAFATAGVVIGTIVGTRVLIRIPERWFRRVLALVLAALGAAMVNQVASPVSQWSSTA
jgi:hypothetical protein